MVIFLLSVVAAVIPTLFYIIIIYWADRYEKEPWWLLTAAFFWGAIPSIIAALVLNTLFSLPVYYLAGTAAGDAFGAVFAAPLVEETLKGIALLGILLLWRHEIDSVLDGIIYGAMIGLGFGMVEDVFYYMGTYAEAGVGGWITNITLRTFFSLNHALFTGMTGLGIALAQLSRKRLVKIAGPIGGWTIAVFLHFVHNASATAAGAISGLFCLILPLNAWGGVLITVIIMVGAIFQERRWLRDYLLAEVADGVLTEAQYAVAVSSRRRFVHGFGELFSGGPVSYWRANKFFNRCSKLAYKKHHYSRFKDDKSAVLIPKLRAEVAELSAKVIVD